MIHERLRGIIPACVTPMAPDGALDDSGLRANIAHWNTTGLAGYLVLGSTGEVVMLSEAEQARVLEVARAAIPADRLMIAGAGEQSTAATIAAARRAAEAGADAALVMPHFYFKAMMTTSVLARHFRAVADASPIPILLYNVPAFTGVALSPDLVAEVAQHPNIIGIKDSAGDPKNTESMRRRTPPEFRIMTGSAPALLGALADGTAGGAILAAANITFRPALEVDRAVRAGDLVAARAAHRRLMLVADEVVPLGVGGWKAGMELLGLSGGPPRPPLPAPGEGARERLERAMQAAGLIEPAGEA